MSHNWFKAYVTQAKDHKDVFFFKYSKFKALWKCYFFQFVLSKINILCARVCIEEPVLAILARQNSTENDCIEENAVCISLIHAGINLLSILSSSRVME